MRRRAGHLQQGDRNADGQITVDEIVAAVAFALDWVQVNRSVSNSAGGN
jgi:hypothetical protein